MTRVRRSDSGHCSGGLITSEGSARKRAMVGEAKLAARTVAATPVGGRPPLICAHVRGRPLRTISFE